VNSDLDPTRILIVKVVDIRKSLGYSLGLRIAILTEVRLVTAGQIDGNDGEEVAEGQHTH